VKSVPGLSLRTELLSVTLVGWLAFVAIPLSLGQMGLSWDALNHHIYLGWTAESPRFARDYLAASFQSYQFPYLYWPVYKLAAAGVSGQVAGVVLATLNAAAIPAVWMIANSCIPGRLWSDAVLRVLAVALAFSSVLLLSMFDSTSNDLLSTVPLAWSVAMGLLAMEPAPDTGISPIRAVLVSGALAGISVACKLSNGPIAVLVPLLWMGARARMSERIRLAVAGGVAAALAFAVAYGYWGWQLWVAVGNPVYPFGDGYFEPLRRWANWLP
jgi:hypothetical protein